MTQPLEIMTELGLNDVNPGASTMTRMPLSDPGMGSTLCDVELGAPTPPSPILTACWLVLRGVRGL